MTIKKEFTQSGPSSPINANSVRVKGNLLNYIVCTCLEQSNAGAFADALIGKEVHKDLLNLITSTASMEL
jgi:hypothetical protein